MDVAIDFMLTTKERAHLDSSILSNMRGVTHILCDKYFLISLMEYQCNNTNIFHLPMGEMTIILTNIHHILWVPMKGTLIQRATLSIVEMEDHCYWLIGIQDYQQQNKGAPLHNTLYMPLNNIDNTYWFILYIMILIDTIQCNDKNHEYFHTWLISIV